MSKSVKLKDNIYWDSSSIIHNQKELSNFLVGETIKITKTLQMTEANVWYETGISGSDLYTGVFIISAYVSSYEGTRLFWERAVGIISWYHQSTNNDSANEIPLHQSGHANNGGVIKLRTKRNFNGLLSLQMSCTTAWTQSSPVTFSFRRMI